MLESLNYQSKQGTIKGTKSHKLPYICMLDSRKMANLKIPVSKPLASPMFLSVGEGSFFMAPIFSKELEAQLAAAKVEKLEKAVVSHCDVFPGVSWG